MSDQHRNRVEQRAYELWEREGRPEGRHDHHWVEAERQIAAESGGTGHAQPAPGDAATALAAHSADAGPAAARTDKTAAQPKPKPPAAAAAPAGRRTA